MKFLAPFLVLSALFVPLTGPDGHTVYVNPDHVSAIHGSVKGYCAPDSHSVVVVDGINLCVAEDAADAHRKLQDTSITIK